MAKLTKKKVKEVKVKKAKKKADPLFEVEVPVISVKQQKKLDKKESLMDKSNAKEEQKILAKFNLIEIDIHNADDKAKINKLLNEDKAVWHHYSCGVHYYKLKQ